MANHYSRAHTNEYICVDENAEEMAGSTGGDQESVDLYPTETEAPPPDMGYTQGAGWVLCGAFWALAKRGF